MTAESFWDFSVRTYRADDVADACLSLQDDCKVDVNVLLFCCWHAARVGRFEDELFQAATEFSEVWYENVVTKLRGARQWMKHTGCHTAPVSTDNCMQLREKIKQAEFAAEKIQEEALEALITKKPQGNLSTGEVIACAGSNLVRYFHHIDQVVSDDVIGKLETIVQAAFPDAEHAIITTAIHTIDS